MSQASGEEPQSNTSSIYLSRHSLQYSLADLYEVAKVASICRHDQAILSTSPGPTERLLTSTIVNSSSLTHRFGCLPSNDVPGCAVSAARRLDASPKFMQARPRKEWARSSGKASTDVVVRRNDGTNEADGRQPPQHIGPAISDTIDGCTEVLPLKKLSAM